ncbi:hypothetical protein FGG08_004425 [Glutinoglossum americanum]|uniref:Uncharacterized protein n=1 Tax=Glutinoglossum americanum TaxID=1670608 RepID=A0A9P8I0H0_9PEZI|nr:hypothetical protein FGG08_004425 [Glutinoglossum americanum]
MASITGQTPPSHAGLVERHVNPYPLLPGAITAAQRDFTGTPASRLGGTEATSEDEEHFSSQESLPAEPYGVTKIKRYLRENLTTNDPLCA